MPSFWCTFLGDESYIATPVIKTQNICTILKYFFILLFGSHALSPLPSLATTDLCPISMILLFPQWCINGIIWYVIPLLYRYNIDAWYIQGVI